MELPRGVREVPDGTPPGWHERRSADRSGTPDQSVERATKWRESQMAAMKPRTGDGPLEVTKEGRGIVMRVPLEGGGRLVVEISADEAAALGDALKAVVN
jgi:hypothetical protein